MPMASASKFGVAVNDDGADGGDGLAVKGIVIGVVGDGGGGGFEVDTGKVASVEVLGDGGSLEPSGLGGGAWRWWVSGRRRRAQRE